MLLTNWLNVFSGLRSRQRRSNALRRTHRRADLASRPAAPVTAESLETRTLLTAPDPLALGGLDGTDGVIINGALLNDRSGTSVNGVGDVNGDGLSDVAVTAPGGNNGVTVDTGIVYVLFGKTGGFSPSGIDLSSLSPTDGFLIFGEAAQQQIGGGAAAGNPVVDGAGDFNGDGFADIIIGAPQTPGVGANTGAAYVLFGKSSFGASVDLNGLPQADGFRLNGTDSGDFAGHAVSSAGDLNGDGLDDVVVGAYGADGAAQYAYDAGEVYVLFGTRGSVPSTVALSSIDDNPADNVAGFRLNGIDAYDFTGVSVDNAGDVDGDGVDDLIVGGVDGNNYNGESYLIYGQTGGFASSIDLSTLAGGDGSVGTVISGAAGARVGLSVSGDIDINGDGLADLLIGGDYGNSYTGQSFQLFGQNGGLGATVSLPASSTAINGSSQYDLAGRAVSGLGDVNGDGMDDSLIGAYNANYNNTYGLEAPGTGRGYVLFGAFGGVLSDLNGNNGFRVDGENQYDAAGQSVGRAGDFNGDGFDDAIIGAPTADVGTAPVEGDAGKSYLVFGGNFNTVANTVVVGGGLQNANLGFDMTDRIVGSIGDDTLNSDGGADILTGGLGNDTFGLDVDNIGSAFQFRGGGGTDTVLSGGTGTGNLTTAPTTIDLTALNNSWFDSIEVFDLRDGVTNTLTLDVSEVINLSDSAVGLTDTMGFLANNSNALVVRRDGADTVNDGGGWTPAGTTEITSLGATFDVLTQGNAVLLIEQADGLEVNVAPASVGEESGTPLVYTFERPDGSGMITVNFSVGGDATNVTDYMLTGATSFDGTNGTIVMADTVTMVSINVTPVSDGALTGEVELDETVTVTIEAGAYNIGSPSIATGTITDDDTSTVNIAAGTNGNEAGPVNGTFTVSLGNTNNSSTDTVVSYNVGGAAESGSDFTALSGTVTIPAGMNSATITVPVIDDNIVELDTEDVMLTLTNITSGDAGITLGTTTASITITDNDSATVSVAAGADVAESATSGTYTVTLSAESSTDTMVNFAFQSGSSEATEGSDFTAFDGTLTISAGDTTGTITVPILNDVLVEGDESVTVMLTGVSGDAQITVDGSNDTDSFDILDNDTATISFVNAAQSTNEEDAADIDVAVQLNLTGDIAGTPMLASNVVVNVADAGTGTATEGAGNDYTDNGASPVTFMAGDGDGTMRSTADTTDPPISVLDDVEIEANETVVLSLAISGSDLDGQVTASSSNHTVTINDDDTPRVVLNTLDATADEGTGSDVLTFQVERETGATDELIVNFALDGTSTAELSDFTVDTSGAVTFDSGSGTGTVTLAMGVNTVNITVTPTTDAIVEDDETVVLVLQEETPPNTNYNIGTPSMGTGTIENDDSAIVTIDDVTTTESDANQTATYTVTLDNPVEGGFTLAIGSTAGTATDTTDFSLQTTSVTFAGTMGETESVSVTVVGDTIVEDNETYTVTLGAVSGTSTIQAAAITATDTGAGQIDNDDMATLSISAPTITEGDTDATATFTVSVDAAVQGGFMVAFADALGTAEAGDLSVTTASPLTFTGNAGETQDIDVNIVGDTIVEDNETFTITLGDVTGTTAIQDAAITTGASDTGTINNDDSATLSIMAGAANQTEGNAATTDVTYTVTLDNAVEGGLTVALGTSGNADDGTDFTLSGTSLMFAGTAGEMETFDLQINGDAVVEDNETATVTLGDVTMTTAVQDAAITTGASDSTVIDNDDTATVMISAGSASVLEGDMGTQDVVYTVSVVEEVQGGFTVALDLTGVDGTDASIPASVTFAGTGNESTMVNLTINGDNTVELNETATVTLGTVSGTSTEQQSSITATASDSTIIQNDDMATVTLTAPAATNEGAAGDMTQFRFTVSLDNPVDVDVTASFADIEGTALVSDSDYVDPSGTVTFSAGTTADQFIDVIVNGDANIEADETFQIELSSLMATSRNVMFAGGMATETATATILNDEADWGDAPDGSAFAPPNTYPTLAASNGAFHVQNLGTTLQLGDLIDSEPDGQPTAAADGDGPDDDGIFFVSDLNRADNIDTSATINVEARLGGGVGFLTGWIDFNRDGDFTDSGEKIVDDTPLAEGTNSIIFTIPSGTASVAGITYSRFRISDATGTLAAGAAAGSGAGEVEDYQITLQDIGMIEPEDVTFSVPGGGSDLTLSNETGNLVIRRNADNVVLFSRIDGSINTLTVQGTDADDDTLTIDFANGDPIPTGGVVFNGGSLMGGGDNDTLNVLNTDAAGITSTTIDYANANDGTITESDGTNTFTIDFTGLDPLTHGPTVDLVLNLPDTADDATVTAGAAGTNVITSNTATFETTTFSNPTGSLTINAGGGDDSVVVTSLDGGFAATLTINGEDGGDTLSTDGVGTAVTINGGSGADSMTGGTQGDRLDGGAGDDTIDGMDGNDTLTGGGGDDSLTGGNGTTTLQETALPNLTLTTDMGITTITGNGTDTLDAADVVAVITGTAGNNNIDADGFAGSVTVDGLGGDDTIRGSGSNDDVIDGGDGNDVLSLSPAGGSYVVADGLTTGTGGQDTFTNIEDVSLVGGTVAIDFTAVTFTQGDVHVIGSTVNDNIVGGQGNDFLNGRAGMDTVLGGPGNDTLLGGNGGDELNGEEGNDRVRGQGGDDSLGGGAGDDRIEGGAGINTLMESVDADVSIRSTKSGARLSGIGNDFISGMTSFMIIGGSSDNTLDASLFDGPVTLDGGEGNDTLIGSAGIDSLIGGNGSDLVRLTVNARNNTITDTSAGGDALDGIERVDVTVARRQGSLVDASAFTGNVSVTGAEGPDTLIGGSAGDRLNGRAGNDVILGNGGNDRLYGGNGRDSIDGGEGNDAIRGHRGEDTLAGGLGNDRLFGNRGNTVLSESLDVAILTIGSNNGRVRITGNGTDNIIATVTGVVIVGGASDNVINATNSPVPVSLSGGAGDDTLIGSVFSDNLDGGEGNDTVQQTVDRNQFITDTQVTGRGTDSISNIEVGVLIGGPGNNRLNGAGFSGSVILIGNDGNDTLEGSEQNDVLDGGAGNDLLIGNGGNDTMRGGDGDDSMQGGFGNDVMLGSAGNDTLDGQENNDSLLGEDGDDSVDGNLGVDVISGGGNGSTLTPGDIAADSAEIDNAIMFTTFDDLLMGVV